MDFDACLALRSRRCQEDWAGRPSHSSNEQQGATLDWNVAVYCANEGGRLQRCLGSIAAALSDRRAIITVILNGSRDSSRDVAREAARLNASIEVFEISAADKSNAINQFHYRLRSPARAYAAVDGYVSVSAETFRLMERKLESNPQAVILAGIAANGRTEVRSTHETVAVGGRLHGQLYAVRPEFLDRMVARGIKLPIGLYRGDGLLGSMAAHNLDPLAEPWDNMRLPGVEGATYEIQPLSLFRPAHLRRQFRRKIRQMRGTIENAAIKSLVYRGGYEALPENADDMIRSYLAAQDAPRVALVNRIFQRLAIRDHRRAPRHDLADLEPRRIVA